MKTLFICLLILSNAWGSKPEISRPAPGGNSVLAVNPSLSSVSWKAEKTTGTHLGTVRIQSGSLNMRCGQLDKGTVLINMSSLEVTDLSAPDKQKLENNLKGNNFFETEKFPTARLEIVSVDHKSEKINHFITVLSNLTVHGITKQIVFTADVSKSNWTDFAAQADLVINRKDFSIATSNIKYNTFINNNIRLHVSLQASKPNEQLSSL